MTETKNNLPVQNDSLFNSDDYKKEAFKLSLENQKLKLKRNKWEHPLFIAIIVTIIGIGVAAWFDYKKNESNLEYERYKFETELIKEALEQPTIEKKAGNLSFLKNIGLLTVINQDSLKQIIINPEQKLSYKISFHTAVRIGIITVREAKTILKLSNYFYGEINDKDTPEFRNAVNDFQKGKGLIKPNESDYELGPKVAKALFALREKLLKQ